MNDEQIKEVMRLSDDIRTAHTSEWDVSDLVEAQNDLEAYLRTIDPAPQVIYVPAAERAWEEAQGFHPNDDTKPDPECQKALDVRGDNESQGLDSYWKWGFRSGWCAAKPKHSPLPEMVVMAQNTFPLNPNGSSKWAHLQKHDGAQAIGVVFRTGSGSVGSLVDGRVVWADWLAYPNGSKSADSEYTDEDMAAVGRALMSAITQYAPKGWSPADCPSEIVGDLHNECEELRSDAERYRKLRDVDAWGEDTAPDGGSAWARLGELHGSEFDAFVDSRAESAIESPAKVSPCAGHAVQLPDPLGLLPCTHPDCGRYEGPRSHECRAMADNACARPSICQGHAAQQEAAESAIETPAKVSPCAGHAVQLPDPLGLLSCTHPDCGRYEGPRSHECRAMADNACARPSICQGHAVQQDADALLARIARAIWGLRREEEDRCDMELEDMPHDHSVWQEAKAAIEAMKGGS